jgi:2-dehydro-3-deoxyphosphogluconate aldolase / (4S)-4-hydroxy-2-oxoglutarate aldolase
VARVTKQEVRGWIEEIGVIPVLRTNSSDEAIFVADAVFQGGIPIAEVAMTAPGATKAISQLLQHAPPIVVGAGSVLDIETARIALDAGAQFLTTDGFHPDVTTFAVREGVVVIPGSLSPTEVIAAWKIGCDFVKVAPCAQIGGEAYIKALHKMFPHIPLIAAGGVSQQNATNFIVAGAVALGIGDELIPRDALHRRQGDRIGELARRFVGFVKAARAELAARTRGLRPVS